MTSIRFSCMLCNSTQYVVRQGHARDDASLVPLECTACGLVSLSSLDHIGDDFYANARMHESQPCDPALELQQCKEDTERRFEQWKNCIAGKHLLDIGCGAGGFLLKAREVAASVAGVEPELRLQEYFVKNNLLVSTSLSALPRKNNLDVVTMFHVLEHIRQPRNLLEEIYELGARTLIIEVPSANDALLTLYGNKAFSEFTYWSCHLYLYTPSTLRTLLESVGFKTKKIIQYQRYPLPNHLYWLSKSLPGGQTVWGELFSQDTCRCYAEDLARQEKCDTIIGVFEC